MSRFQSKIMIRTLIISLWWAYFSYSLIGLWLFGSIQWAISILLIWVWMWRRQTGIWFLAIVSCCITCLQYVFSVIPTYDHKPSLDIFLASQVPFISCIPRDTPKTIILNNESIWTEKICTRTTYPIYIGQEIQLPQTGAVIVWYGNGASTHIMWPAKGSLQRTSWWVYTIQLIQWTGSTYNPQGSWYAYHPQQYTIASTFQENKKTYLQKNYKRVREEAPLLTKVAIRKMRILGIVDRSYSTQIDHLQFYMQQVTGK